MEELKDFLPGIAIGVVVLVLTIIFLSQKNAKPKATAIFLNKKRKGAALVEKIELSHDTRLFRFALPTATTALGLPAGKHIKLYCPNPKPTKEGEWNGREDPEANKKEIERKYTPTSGDENLGHFDLVIKVYKGGVIDRFPDGGKMSQYLESMNIGDSIDVQGPYGLYEFNGKGNFTIKRKIRNFKKVGMISGGTGITPMLRVLVTALEDKSDSTKFWLLYANQTEGDILVRDTLEKLQAENPGRFSLHYTLDRPPSYWKYSEGFINEDMIKKNLPPPGDETVVLMCGPPPMLTYACKPNLDKLGYAKDIQIEF